MPYAIPAKKLADFQCYLIGTWTNLNVEELIDPERGLPLAYNVMPLPQVAPQSGRPLTGRFGHFILKNFAFTETIRFNGSAEPDDSPEHRDAEALAVAAGAPNRGGSYTQSSHALFYEQQVQFAEGPDGPRKSGKPGKIVHVENGTWLHFGSELQVLGPYLRDPDKKESYVRGPVLPQPPYVKIAKQISVPHGNSVLALGSVDIFDTGDPDRKDNPNTVLSGPPVIPDAFIPYPEAADITVDPQIDPYKTPLEDLNDFENPSIDWTWNANKPLQTAIEIIKPRSHIHWRVTTRPQFGGSGVVTNIPFEESKSKVVQYWADYWLLSKDRFEPGKEPGKFDYLAYTQTMLMEMDIYIGEGPLDDAAIADPRNFRRFTFPHVTSSTVKRVRGTPEDARSETESLERGVRARG